MVAAPETPIREVLARANFCNCGGSGPSGADSWGIVLEVLEFFSTQRAPGTYLSSIGPAGDERWVIFAAKVCDSHGWLEHGSNVSFSWLTPEGERVLAFLKEHGVDTDEWPEWTAG